MIGTTMITIDGNQLTINQVVEVARNDASVTLSQDAHQRVLRASEWVSAIVAADNPVYGINTGFGIFADNKISPSDANLLSRNLILSHAVGTGSPLPVEVVRAAMLIRANTLAKGHSGVRPVVIQTLLQMLEKQVIPEIPSQGSLGSSGDLAPLAHLSLVFTTDEADRDEDSGWAIYQGERLSGKDAMARAKIKRIILGPKEGLAMINGATFSVAIGALVVYDAQKIIETSKITLAMSLESLLGVTAAYDERIHRVRSHPGQLSVAADVLQLVHGSTLVDSDSRVQDAYSLRCGPQVQGCAVDTLQFVNSMIAREINSATDNPLLFDPGIAISGGNFHGEPIGMFLDFLGIAISELGSISERRIFRMTDGKLNYGLPAMLVDHPAAAGLNSGMMMPQYTAASLVLENLNLATPDSVLSLPTSAEQEDHNANAMTAARHARQIVDNTTHILAIEAYTAARALDLRRRANPEIKLGLGVHAAYQVIRQVVPYQPGDAWWSPEIAKVKELINSGQLNKTVYAAIDANNLS
jgi:histidine ammonia-lyase